MKYISLTLLCCSAAIVFPISPAGAQEFDSLDPVESYELTDTSSDPIFDGLEDSESSSTSRNASGMESELEPTGGFEQGSQYSDGSGSLSQNAIIEGVQISTEPGDKPEEKVVTCYFIFRDKPSSYFYEVKVKEKKIYFEFNDTKRSTAPIPINTEPPIESFVVEERKVDVNKEVRGLMPEYHSQVRVIFKVSSIPDIHVQDEFNIISYSYKWSSNPEKTEKYTMKDHSPKVVLWSMGVIAGIGGGVLGYYLYNRPVPEPLGEISITDLPKHELPPLH